MVLETTLRKQALSFKKRIGKPLTHLILSSNPYDYKTVLADKVVHLLKPWNCKFIDSGLDRLAFSLRKDLVLKVARGSASTCQNKAEIRIYRYFQRNQQKTRSIFLPLLAWDRQKTWILTPRVETEKSSLLEPQVRKITKSIDSILTERGIIISDLHDGNVGLYNGNPVIIDYGLGISITRRNKEYEISCS